MKNAVLSLCLLALAAPALAAPGDKIPDRVLGQRRFNTSAPFLIDGRFTSVSDVAVDRSVKPNRAYVADVEMNRVLGWSDVARLRAGAPADLVLGQRSLVSGLYIPDLRTCPPPSAESFCRPQNLAVDPAGNLYVADALNHRVLEFDSPFTTDRLADRVFGQPGFTSRDLLPQDPPVDVSGRLGLAVDGAGNLWMIATDGSRRVLEFDAPTTHDTRPDRVIEPASEDECFARHPADRLCSPYGLGVSPQGDLYVRDASIWQGTTFLRVFRQPLTTDLAPDFNLFPVEGTGLRFDPAGNLYFTSGSALERFPAPVGPGSEAEVLFHFTTLDTFLEGPLDIDAAGDLLIARYVPTYERGTGFVFVLTPPYLSRPLRIGQEDWPQEGGLWNPSRLAVDRSTRPNRLYALDAHNRVLGWKDAEGLANGALPDLVIAGSDRDLCDRARAAVDPRHFCAGDPDIRGGIAVDSRGNLWLSDTYNNRVLEYDRPFETDGIADRVLGQRGSFTSGSCNKGGRGAASLCLPGALALDGADRLYVADINNHRVLRFDDPLRAGAADQVFGQSGFRDGACNRGRPRPRADSLCLGYEEGDINVRFHASSGLAVDSRGILYVADSENARVLLFRDPLRSTLPDAVLGQDGRFDTDVAGTGPGRFAGSSTLSFLGPGGIAAGPDGTLYVADTPNDRVLVFRDPLRDGTAQEVIGHDGFDAGGVWDLQPLPPGPARLFRPMDVAVDALGNLWVADWGYNRVLRYDRP